MHEENLKRRGLIHTGYYLPYNPKLAARAKEMRKTMTRAERKLWYGFLHKWKHKFRPQHPIDNYIVDFYCADLKLVIEVDGEQHHKAGGKCYDTERDAILESYGLKVLRFPNADVMNRFHNICEIIARHED